MLSGTPAGKEERPSGHRRSHGAPCRRPLPPPPSGRPAPAGLQLQPRTGGLLPPHAPRQHCRARTPTPARAAASAHLHQQFLGLSSVVLHNPLMSLWEERGAALAPRRCRQLCIPPEVPGPLLPRHGQGALQPAARPAGPSVPAHPELTCISSCSSFTRCSAVKFPLANWARMAAPLAQLLADLHTRRMGPAG